tara:strand:- start:675 stop:1169 length:495 start_codon:yes stop_codon:yes gene_type:complete
MPVQAPTLVENYMSNAEHILSQAITHGDFTRRVEGTRNMHQAKIGGPISQFSSWFIHVENSFADTIFETIPQDRKHCTQLVLNKYEPGDYLVKHCDAQGLYWKFKLIYLTAGPKHFCWYDDHDNQHFIEEKVGAMLDMDIGLYHEVTQIGEGEPTKYSLCLLYE